MSSSDDDSDSEHVSPTSVAVQNSASSVELLSSSTATGGSSKSSKIDERRRARRNRTDVDVKLRLNEDGEVDWRGSWRDTWHQRLLLIINFIFLLFGFALLLAAIYAIRTNLIDFLSDTPLFQAIGALGLFVVVLSLIGCFGAYYEIRWLLVVYAIILFGLLVAQLACGVFVYVRSNQAPAYVQSAWAATSNPLRVQVQNMYSCCGLFTYNDSTAGQPCPSLSGASSVSAAATASPTLVPGASGNFPTTAPTSSDASVLVGPTACLSVLLNTAQSASFSIGVAVISLATCQLLATILVVWMLCRMRSMRRKMEEAAALPDADAASTV